MGYPRHMPEYKYVSLPTDGKQIRSADVDAYATAELNDTYIAAGCPPPPAPPPAPLGPIGFLLIKQ
jgi:hypothetical protein